MFGLCPGHYRSCIPGVGFYFKDIVETIIRSQTERSSSVSFSKINMVAVLSYSFQLFFV